MPTYAKLMTLLGVFVLLAPVGLWAADPAGPPARPPDRHEEPPAQAPAAPAERVTAPGLSPQALRVGGYQSVQVNVDKDGKNILNDAANEPTIAIDPTNPNHIVVGWRQFDHISSDFREAGFAYSHDNGRHWTFPGVLEEGFFRSDPVLSADADGNFYYYSLTNVGGYSCQMFKSTDKGVTWVGPIQARGGDKEWMEIDRTLGVGRGHIYAAWDSATIYGDNWFTRSTDGGMTWMYPIPIPLRPEWGTVAIGNDGEVLIAGRVDYAYSPFVFVRSSNAKYASQTPTFEFSTKVELGGALVYYNPNTPNPGGMMGQPWIAVDKSSGPTRDNLYMLCSVDPPGSDPLDVHIVRSVDDGKTWSTPKRINDDPPWSSNWNWFGTLSVAPNGRLDVTWYDTREGPTYRWSRLRYSYSLDAGDTWSPSEVFTPAFDSWLGWPNQNKLGDYVHQISDNVGVSLAYAATLNGEQDVYYVRIGDYDCNGNGIGDAQDIASGYSTDLNGNGIPDECDGLGDLNCDGQVDAFDIDPFVLALTDPAGYAAKYPKCDAKRADINGDAKVDAFDIDPFVSLLTGG